MRVLAAGALYFGLVFVGAFLLGMLRTFILEPTLGGTWAVACEIPFLIVVIVLAARLILRRFPTVRSAVALLAVGVIGLTLQQAAELGFVLLSGETLADHAAYLSTIAGRLYLSALGVFLMAPLVLGEAARRHASK